MMLAQLMAVERLKIRRKAIWSLAVAGPIGLVLLMAVNFTLRYEYLTGIYASDLWGGMLDDLHKLSVPVILMGMTIVPSMIAGIEHATNAWKQTLALPVSRTSVYTAKFLLLVLLMLVCSMLLCIGTVILGLSLSFGTDIPYGELIRFTFFPTLAALPIGAFQLWLSVTLANQAVPLTIGIIGTVASPFSLRMADLVPYKWPYLANQWNEPFASVAFGVLCALLLVAAGCFHFARKDVS